MNRDTFLKDTHPKIEEYLIEKWRKASTWDKIKQVNEMYFTLRLLALTGVRRRCPALSENELDKEIAKLFLGEELVCKIYGCDSNNEGD
jgi:hypothetical protein